MNSQGPGRLPLPPLQSFTPGSHIPDQGAEPSGDSEWSDHCRLAWSESMRNSLERQQQGALMPVSATLWLLSLAPPRLSDVLGWRDSSDTRPFRWSPSSSHSLLQFQSFLGRFLSRILVRARFNLHFIPVLPVCEIKKMEIESPRCPEIVLSIENLNEKWGQRDIDSKYPISIRTVWQY